MRVENAAKVVEKIEIQIAGGNLLRIRSRKSFWLTASPVYAYISVAEFFVPGGIGFLDCGELSSAGRKVTCKETQLPRWKRRGTYV
jgi:hypothetical protein